MLAQFRRIRESCIASELCHIVRALRIISVSRRDEGKAIQFFCNRFHVLFMHLGIWLSTDGVGIVCREVSDWQRG